MKNLWRIVFLLVFSCGAAAAQANPQRVNVRGQVYMPGGAQFQGNLRIQLSGEDGHRPPEYVFTDSKGGFILNGLATGSSYILVVESDGKNWAPTRETVWVLGSRPFVTLQLRALESTRPSAPTISVAELNQAVPRAAKREFEIAVEQMATGDNAHAQKSFERAIQMFPDFVEARSELSVVLMREGNLAGAEALLRKAVELDSAAVRPQLNLGLCLYRQMRYTDALPYLARGVQLQGTNANANLLYGMTLVMAGDDEHAEPVLRRAYELGGKNFAKAEFYLARLYTRQKKYDLAAGALDTYLRDVPDEPNADSLRGTLVKLRTAAHP